MLLKKMPESSKVDNMTELFINMWNRLRQGKIWSGRIINKKKDGTLYEEETTISPVQNAQGEIINYVAVKRDVTQEVALEAQLRQAQKMEAIGTLAGGIAHDFNNILTPIIINTEMALLDLTPDSELRQDLNQVLKAGRRAKELVRQILTFSRQKEEELKPLLLSPVIKEALQLIRSTLPSTIEIRSIVEAESAVILADLTRIHQILMNLCTNAAHAMANKRGLLEVRLVLKEFFNDSPVSYPELKAGRYVSLIVSDTGEGITPEIMDKIFDPFFTTRKLGEGTGLGLSVVHGIVKSHGGALSVKSKIGEGTSVEVLFPLLIQATAQEENELTSLPTGQGHILFVDDEEDILISGKKMLERLGYTVEITNKSTEALKVFTREPDRYDLVITDQTMALMTGTDLARELLRIRPYLPIIVITGYSDSLTLEKVKKIGISEFVMKPLVTDQIAETIDRVMKRHKEQRTWQKS
jgi:signal transduction histidine kinase/ActR/RegA family two-component response regulator